MRRDRKVSIRQRDQSDCGPACIASVMSYYGLKVPVARIRQEAGTDREGTSMWGMIKVLEHFNFESKGLKGSPEHLSKLPLPSIAHIQHPDGMQHYVCIYKVDTKRLRVMDPADGRIHVWERAEFEKKWSGAVIALVRGISKQDTALESSNQNTALVRLLYPVWRPVLQAMISALVYSILGLSTSIYIGKLTDYVFVTHNTGLLNLMSSLMVLIVLLMIYLFMVRSVITLKTGQIIDNQLIASYYRHIFRLPQQFFNSMKTGEIISRISDAVKIRGFINDSIIGILVNAMIVIFSFTCMFILNWRLALVMAGIIPLYILIYLLYNNWNKSIERKVMEQSASFESQLVESLQSSEYIKQHRLRGRMQQITEEKLNKLLETVYRSGINSIAVSGSTDLINRLFTIALLWTGSYFVISQTLTAGKLISFYALLGYFTGPVTSLIGANKTYQNALIAADRLFEIFHLNPEEAPGKPAFDPSDFGDIAFRNVSFAYGTRARVINDLSLTIEAGKVTVINGTSGSGKSTVASLVRHLYPVNTGSITINGYESRHFSLDSIRALMGVVPQQIRFLSGSLLDNLAPGDRSPDIRKILDLLNGVGLVPLIESLPLGLNTRLSENGTNFSGGERQRLAIVRALYRKPSLLILDEATSSLDPVSAYHVNRLLLELKACSQTMLLITHKKQNTALADNILILEKGNLK
ncbi:MAG: peptidase domain-containing ABC transporter [Bacteroidota bacterium]